MFTFSGFPGVDAKVINPRLAQAVAESVSSRIVYPYDVTASLRTAAVTALGWGHKLDARMDAVWASREIIPRKLHGVVDPVLDVATAALDTLVDYAELAETFVMAVLDMDAAVLSRGESFSNFSGSMDDEIDTEGDHYAQYVSTASTVTTENSSAALAHIMQIPQGVVASSDGARRFAVDQGSVPLEEGDVEETPTAPASFVFGADGTYLPSPSPPVGVCVHSGGSTDRYAVPLSSR
jgi:hypothetical protein